jgi:hypothetical protein
MGTKQNKTKQSKAKQIENHQKERTKASANKSCSWARPAVEAWDLKIHRLGK